MYLILWEYQIKPNRRSEFEKIYVADGDWAKLFQKGTGYLGTELIRSATVPDHYMTIDRWNSKSEYDIFLRQYEAAYKSLDAQCEGLTEHESLLGMWKTVLSDLQAVEGG